MVSVMQRFDLNDSLSGLEDSNTGRRKEALETLRNSVEHSGGVLSTGAERTRFFRVITQLLTDSNWNLSHQCLQFLADVLPRSGREFDSRGMALILPTLVHNLGDNKVVIRKAAAQVLALLVKHSQDPGDVISATVQHGLRSGDTRVRLESIQSLTTLLASSPSSVDYKELVICLCDGLTDRLDSVVQASIHALAFVRPIMGTAFTSVTKRLSPSQRDAFQQHSDVIMGGGHSSGSGGLGVFGESLASGSGSGVGSGRSRGGSGSGSGSGYSDRDRDIDPSASPARGGSNGLGYGRSDSNGRGRGDSDDMDGFGGINGKTLSLDGSGRGGAGGGGGGGGDSDLAFGFVSHRLMDDLADANNWRVRSTAIEELHDMVKRFDYMASVQSHLPKLLTFLTSLLQDPNFKIELTTLQIIGEIVGKSGLDIKSQHVTIVLPSLIDKLGDNKIVVRQANVKVIMRLMQILSPRPIIDQLLASLDHKNWRVREEIINLFIQALLTFKKVEFDFALLASALQGCLSDSKAKVKLTAIEGLAVIHSVIGTRLLHLIPNLDSKTHKLLSDRFSQQSLAFVNDDGLVEHPYLSTRSTTESSTTSADHVGNGGLDDVFRGSSSSRQGSAGSSRAASGRQASAKIPWTIPPLSSRGDGSATDRSGEIITSVGSAAEFDDNGFEPPRRVNASSSARGDNGGRGGRGGGGSSNYNNDVMGSLEHPSSLQTRPSAPGGSTAYKPALPIASINRDWDQGDDDDVLLYSPYPKTPVDGSSNHVGNGPPLSGRRGGSNGASADSSREHSARSYSSNVTANSDATGASQASTRPGDSNSAYGGNKSSLTPGRRAGAVLTGGSDRNWGSSSAGPSMDSNTAATKPIWLPENSGGGGGAPSALDYDDDQRPPSSARRLNSARRGRREGANVPDVSVVDDAASWFLPASGAGGSMNTPSPHDSTPVGGATPMSGRRARHVEDFDDHSNSILSASAPAVARTDNAHGARSRHAAMAGRDHDREQREQERAWDKAWGGAWEEKPVEGPSAVESAVAGGTGTGGGGGGVNLARDGLPGSPMPQPSVEVGGVDNGPPNLQRSASVSTDNIADKLRMIKSKRMSRVDKHLRVMSASAVLTQCNQGPLEDEDMRAGTARERTRPGASSQDNAISSPATHSMPSYTPKLRRYPASAPVGDGPAALETDRVGRARRDDELDDDVIDEHDTMGHGMSSRAPRRTVVNLQMNASGGAGGAGGAGGGATRPAPTGGKGRKSVIEMNAKPIEHIPTDDLKPSTRPEADLRLALERLQSSEWFENMEGLNIIRALTVYNPELVVGTLHTLVRFVLAISDSLRSSLSKAGIMTIADMFVYLGTQMDPELEQVTMLLTKKCGETSTFIADEAKKCLNVMVERATAQRCLNAVLQCTSHRQAAVRTKIVYYIEQLVLTMGDDIVGLREAERLLPALATMLAEGASETRTISKRATITVSKLLGPSGEFDRYLKRLSDPDANRIKEVLEKDAKGSLGGTAVFGLGRTHSGVSAGRMTGGLGDGLGAAAPSYQGMRGHMKSGGSSGGNDNNDELAVTGGGASHKPSSSTGGRIRKGKASIGSVSLAQSDDPALEPLSGILTQLNASDFRQRSEGLTQLADFMLSVDATIMAPKLGAVMEGLANKCNDNNAKVGLVALQTLQKILPEYTDAVGSSANLLVPSVASSLANTNTTVRQLGAEVLDDLIEHVDVVHLVQPFASAMEYGNVRGRALLIDKMCEMVQPAHSRRPAVVTKHVMPVALRLMEEHKADVKQANNALLTELHGVLGRTLHSAASRVSERCASRLKDVLAGASLRGGY